MMANDLKTKDGRNKFIKDNLASILEGINDSYGPVLVDELLRRVDYTITEFNDEMSNAFNLLKEKDEKRIEAMKKYEAENQNNSSSKNEWEKKLENLESE